jgi:hypothetical protein
MSVEDMVKNRGTLIVEETTEVNKEKQIDLTEDTVRFKPYDMNELGSKVLQISKYECKVSMNL